MDAVIPPGIGEGWEEVPHDLIGLLAEMVSVSEVPKLAAVCKAWSECPIFSPNSLLMKGSIVLASSSLLDPRLMLPPRKIPFIKSQAFRDFYRWNPPTYFRLGSLKLLGMECCGFGDGWLVAANQSTKQIILFNIMTKQSYQLPDHPSFRAPAFTGDIFFKKAIVLMPRYGDHILAAIIYGDLYLLTNPHLAKEWTWVSKPGLGLTDIAFDGLSLFGISNDLQKLHTFSLSKRKAKCTAPLENPIPNHLIEQYPEFQCYCVGSGLGELYGVWRPLQKGGNVVQNHSLLVFAYREHRYWEPIPDLGVHTLLMSNHSSMYITNWSPNHLGLQNNAVYFTSSANEVGFSYGIYDMQSCTYQLLHFDDPEVYAQSGSLWVTTFDRTRLQS